MNVMLASGGYPWTVVPLERRDDFMRALESASVKPNVRSQNTRQFTSARDFVQLEGLAVAISWGFVPLPAPRRLYPAREGCPP